jgi:CRP/FNR family transcriptional regulator, nitrogen oxide reductase regulator
MTHSNPERLLTVPSQLFAGMNEIAIAEILAAGHPRKVAAKRVIFSAGEKATHLFVQRTGRIRYFRPTITGDEVLLRLLAPGDTFGIGTLLKNPCPYVGSAEAISEVDMLVWEHASIQNFATLYPQLADNALRIVLRYLKGYVDRHVGLVTKTAEQRLADTLLTLGHRTGRTLPTGVLVDVTNGQLGALADISLFTASRLLSGWERQGTVSKSRGKVLIHSPEALIGD